MSLEEVKVAIYTGKITLLCIYDGNVLIKEIELFDVDPKLISIPTKKKIKLFDHNNYLDFFDNINKFKTGRSVINYFDNK